MSTALANAARVNAARRRRGAPVSQDMVRRLANRWPGATQEYLTEFVRIGSGMGVSDINQFRQVQRTYFSKRFVAAAGVTSLVFFNNGLQPFICNLAAATLPTELAIWVTSIRVSLIDQTLTNNDTVVGGLITSGFAGADAIARAEAKRQLLNNGLLTFQVRDTPVIQTFAKNLPEGSSFAADVATTATTTTIVNANNGAALYQNQNILRSAYPLLPQQDFSVRIDWPAAAYTAMVNGVTVMVELVGEGLVTGQF